MRLLLLFVMVAHLVASDLVDLSGEVKLSLPDGWSRSQSGDGTSIVLRAPDGNAAIAVASDAGTDAAGSLDAALTLLRRLAPGYTIVEPPTEIVLGRRTWMAARYRFHTGSLAWEQRVLVAAINGQVVCITCSASSERFPSFIPRFEEALTGLDRTPSRIQP